MEYKQSKVEGEPIQYKRMTTIDPTVMKVVEASKCGYSDNLSKKSSYSLEYP